MSERIEPIQDATYRAAIAMTPERAGEILTACDVLLAGGRSPLSPQNVAVIRALAASRVTEDDVAGKARRQGEEFKKAQLAARGISG